MELITPKTQTTVKLVGMKTANHAARIGAEVAGFLDADTKFAVTINEALGGDIDSDSIQLRTAKGDYILEKSLTANRYEGTCGTIKVHVCLKKVQRQAYLLVLNHGAIQPVNKELKAFL